MFKITFYLYELRAERGWSQRKLADVAGVSKSQIHAIENGLVILGIDTLLMIARALQVDVSDLYTAEWIE